MKLVRRFAMAAVLMALSLSPLLVFAASPVTRSVGVELNKQDREEELAVWLIYGLSLSSWLDKSGTLEQLPLGPFVPPFEAELEARSSQLQIWKELNEKEPKRLLYMDDLQKVQAAGFLREYVWRYYRRAEWTTEPAGLKLPEFDAWRAENLAGHQPKTGAALRINKAAKS